MLFYLWKYTMLGLCVATSIFALLMLWFAARDPGSTTSFVRSMASSALVAAAVACALWFKAEWLWERWWMW